MQFTSKLLVFVLFATNASFNPFFTLFMQDKGFTALEMGSISSMARTIMVFCTPLVVAYADRNRNHQQLMALLAIVAGSAMIAFYFLSKSFVIACLVVYAICSAAKGAIADTLVLTACRQSGGSYALQRLWGSISWGVTSLAIGVALREAYAHSKNGVQYSSIPLVHGGSMYCLAFVLAFVFKLDSPPAPATADDESSTGSTGSKDGTEKKGTQKRKGGKKPRALPSAKEEPSQASLIILFLKDPGVFFPIVIAVCGLATSESGLSTFLFPYLRTKLGAQPILFSWILVLHSISEVVCFAAGSWLVENVGVGLLLVTSAISFTLKALVYSSIDSAWAILGVEWMHGMCFAFLWTGAVAHVDKCAERVFNPKTGPALVASGKVDSDDDENEADASTAKAAGLRKSAVAMTTLWFFYSGFPPILSGVACGYVVETHGEQYLFRLIAAICMVITGLLLVMMKFGVFAHKA